MSASVIQKYKEVDFGDFTYSRSTYEGINYFRSTTPISDAKGSNYGYMSAKYVPTYNGSGVIGLAADKTFFVYTNGYVYVRDDSYSDATAFQTAVTGQKLIYELATPTTLSATPYTNPQKTAVGGTEEFVDYAKEQGTRDVAVPVGHNTQYKKLPAEWDDDYMLYLQDKAENSLQTGWHDSFANLTDTAFSNLSNGQIPKWNSTSQKWENANESGGGGASSLAELSDTNISSPADGQILKWDGTTSKWVNANEYSYSLPTASASTKGGIKVGDNLAMNGEVLSAKTVPWTSLGALMNGYSVELPSDYEDLLVCLEFMDVDDFKRCSYVFNKAMVDFEPSWRYKPTLETAIHAYSSTFYYATLACSYTDNKKMLNCTTTYNSLTVLIYYR